VLVFSRATLSELEGATVAVTDETSTSFRLLQLLLETRYALKRIHYGRIASAALFDGASDALLLIGDEAMKARQSGIKGLPVVTDLGEEWFAWQGRPFAFARWAIRKTLSNEAKAVVEGLVEKALNTSEMNRHLVADLAAIPRGLTAVGVEEYWSHFEFRLTRQHLESIELFRSLLEKQCSLA
jgi:chorismate dehydratase